MRSLWMDTRIAIAVDSLCLSLYDHGTCLEIQFVYGSVVV
jgi:hypothetical protein